MFDPRKIPDEDHATVEDIRQSLEAMRAIVREFAASLDLYQFTYQVMTGHLVNADRINGAVAQAMPSGVPSDVIQQLDDHVSAVHNADQTKSWQRVAARAGAILPYGWSQVSQDIGLHLKKVQSSRDMIDLQGRSEALKLFSKTFPDFGDIRNAAAHHGEMFSDQRKANLHAAPGPAKIGGIRVHAGAGGTVAASLQSEPDQCVMSWTVKKKVVSFELSPRTLEVMRDITLLYASSFAQMSRYPPGYWERRKAELRE